MPDRGLYAALVNFYDDDYQGVPVRVAVLLQPVSGTERQGMATIQVAETLELRQTLARQILLDTLWRQAGLVLVIAAVVVAVVHRVTRWWPTSRRPHSVAPPSACASRWTRWAPSWARCWPSA